jgi:hypothetical protein
VFVASKADAEKRAHELAGLSPPSLGTVYEVRPYIGPAPSPAPMPPPAPERKVKAPELRDTADIAKRIRADIQDRIRDGRLPKGKYGVTTSKYSMGSSITVLASKLPFPVLEPAAFHLEKGASYASFDRDHYKSRYTAKAESLLHSLNAIVDAYHWDRSDPMSDYYNERFAKHVDLGDEGREHDEITKRLLAQRGRK